MARNKSYREPEDSFNEMGVQVLNSRIAADAAASGKPSLGESVASIYRKVRDGIDDDLKRQEEERSREEERKDDPVRYRMSSAYQSDIKDYDSLLNSLEARAEEYRREHETYQKGARSRAVISGIGDSISSLANLIGVGNWASNQKQEYQSPRVAADAERERREHQIRMDGIRDRMDRLKDREREARLAMSLGLAEYDVRRRAEKEAADAAAAKAAADNLRWAAEESARQGRHEDEMELARQRERRLAQEGREKAGAARQYRERESFRKDYGEPVDFSYYGEDGKRRTISIGKLSLEETGRRNYDVLRDEIAKSYGFDDFSDYRNQLAESRRGKIDGLSESGAEELRELSNDFDEDQISRLVDKYGVRSPRFMALLEGSAGNYANAPVVSEERSRFSSSSSSASSDDDIFTGL